MPCVTVNSSSFTLPPIPSSGFPGGGHFAPQLPPLNIPFPNIPLEDLTGLFNSISFLLPPGILKPDLTPDVLNGQLEAINSIIAKFIPFLMIYSFILPVLNLILCIIEVLCSLLNPFSLGGAISRLFRECIPEFLSLFPAFAIPLMIISLLILIITLILYLITRVIAIIEVIIENIEILSQSASRLDNDSIIAITAKIGDLLCTLQSLFVILGPILLIIQLIESMLKLGFHIPPCDDSGGQDSPCCGPSYCPDFIKNNSTITSSTGNLLYFNEVGTDSGLSLPFGFPPIVATIRQESWQFYDPNLSVGQAFINITQPHDLPPDAGKVFFPAGTSYTTTSTPSLTPYTISFRFFYVPADFSFNPSDPKGPRYMRISNAIVQNPPIAGVSSYNNQLIAPFNGTLNLVGGVVTEDNGTPISDSNGHTVPINTFIHRNTTAIPSSAGSFYPNDGYSFSNLTYSFSINHEVLVGQSLITLGCIPEVALNKNFVNATIGAQFNTNTANLTAILTNPGLPDVAGAQNCIANAVSTYVQNISIDSTNQFQATVLNCLNTLQNQASSALTAAVAAGYDQYHSDFHLDTPIQFTTLPITVFVSLNESSGQSMTQGLPISSADALVPGLSGKASFGSLGQFSYDGYQYFTAEITSPIQGNGNIEIAFNNNFISILSNPTDITQPGSVSIKNLPYTFVQSSVIGGPGAGNGAGSGGSGAGGSAGDVGGPRRDEGDTAGEVTGGE
jgi:hypothetical protein